MKHIKRKFLSSHNITKDAYELLLKQPINNGEIDIKKINKSVPFLITQDQKFIQAFNYEYNGFIYQIPEPNPIIIYFSNAQGFLSKILDDRENLLQNLKKEKTDINEILNHMFSFYSCVVNYSASLFDSIEAFINSKIPKDFKYENHKRRNKIMNKYEIIRYSTFEDKVKIILPQIYNNKNFSIERSHQFEILLKLKKLRDNITHAKADLEYDVNYYTELFTEALNFDYLKAIESSKDFINFFEENLIEPCHCGLEH